MLILSKAIRTFQLRFASIMDEMAPSFYTENDKEVVGKLFPTYEKISVDQAVMEKSKEIYTSHPQDEAGNAKVGKDILACINARTVWFMLPMKARLVVQDRMAISQLRRMDNSLFVL